MQQNFDIIVVGGGMVGTTLAIALQQHGYRVAMIEAFDASGTTSPPGFDDRGIALSWGSSRLLKQLQLWQGLKSHVAAIEKIHVSDKGHFGITHIDAYEEKVPALGYVVSAREIGSVLMSSMPKNSDQFQFFCPAGLIGIKQETNSVVATINRGNDELKLGAKLLVAADGAQSTVRCLLDIAASEKQYGQDAVIANITPELNHNNVAYERFTADGPIALLPMRAHQGMQRCALIWTVPENDSKALLKYSDAEFLRTLQSQFGYRLGHLLTVGKRASYPLSLVQSQQRHLQRIVFIGNAAQTLHPVAGQGFNLALRDLSVLLDNLIYPALAVDPGSNKLLERFQELRRRDQASVIYFTDSLIGLFSNHSAVLGCARGAGLMVLDTFPGLRRLLARQAMGLNMPLPHISNTPNE